MKRTILVVDDILANRCVLTRLLGADYHVEEACDGKEAIEFLLGHPSVSAVLLDILMPVMDGYEVLSFMQGDEALSQIPVVIISGDPEAEARALSLGAIEFVSKPFDSGIIRQRLANIIKLRATSSLLNAYQTDRLTGLLNRDAFFDRAAEMIARQPPGHYVLGCMDIDSFKVFNNRFGTEMGDRVLEAFAAKLKSERETDDGICGRIDGDSFVVLCPEKSMPKDAISQKMREYETIATLPHPVTVSVGYYAVNDKSLGVSAMYDRAKMAQETVKGRYDVHVAAFDESMCASLVEEQMLFDAMLPALGEGQFEVWFQPQYDHASGAIIGAEALVRWNHPEQGIIAPAVFIPMFERNGFIGELDRHVWRQVCAYLRTWIEEGRNPLPVSVNVSRYDMLDDGLANVLEDLVEQYGIPKGLLRLEVTESAFVDFSTKALDVIKELVSRGFTVEIDDFGSGYSSLNALKDIPAQGLKIDMRFLESIDENARGGKIIESIVRMTEWIGMTVIAEGVETVEQADYLRSIGCSHVQGYLYARPMPAREYERLAASAEQGERHAATGRIESLEDGAFWNPTSMDTLIFNSYVGAACVFERHGEAIELLRVNEKYVDMIGGGSLSTDDVMEKNLPFSEHVGISVDAELHCTLERFLESGEESSCDIRLRRDSTGDIYIRMTVRPIARAGERTLFYCTVVDMTDLREAEQALRVSREEYRLSIEHSGKLIYRYRHADDSVELPENITSLFGLPSRIEDVPEGLISDGVVSEETKNQYRDMFRAIKLGDKYGEVAIRRRTADGEWRWYDGQFSTVFDDIGMPVSTIIVFEDTTERREEDREMEKRLKAAEVDGMTGVYNKTTTEELVAKRLAGREKCALLVADLDNLKLINDTSGHIEGDCAIRAMAATLRARFRQSDIVGRVGGDEFVVFLEDVTEDNLKDMLPGFMDVLASSDVGESGLSVSCSIGVAIGEPGDTYESLFDKADKALYHVKRTGRGGFAFFGVGM